MTDTLKTRSQLLTVDFVANAGTGAIGSQQFRNHVVSAMGCYGNLVTNAGSTQFTLAAATYQDVKPFASSGASSDLTVSTTNGTITVPTGGDGVYNIDFNVTLQRDSVVSSDQKFFIKLVKNSSEVATRATSIAADTQYGSISGHAQVSLVATDVIKLQIAHVAGALATLVSGDLSANRIG